MQKYYYKPLEWNMDKARDLLSSERVRKMIDLAGSGKTILDVGCFTGDIAKKLQSKDNTVIGLDCNKWLVDKCNSIWIPAYLCNFEEKFPVPDSFVDLVFCGEIIEHVYNTENFLRECYRVLKFGGEIVLSTPNINWLSFRWQMLWGKTLPFGIESGEEYEFPGHCRYYTVESLKETLEKFGFRVELITSDVIMNKKIKLKWLAEVWPGLGYHLIIKARKTCKLDGSVCAIKTFRTVMNPCIL